MGDYKIISGQVYQKTRIIFHKYPKIISIVYKAIRDLLRAKNLWMSQDEIIKLDATNREYRSIFWQEPSPEDEAIFKGIKLDPKDKVSKDLKIYYLYTHYEVQPTDKDYELFFFLCLLYTDILEMDNFLYFQEKIYTSFTNISYCRFLELLLRKYDHEIFLETNPAVSKIVHEYIESNQNNSTYLRPSIYWSRTNETEFVQMAYGLIKAGCIDNDEHEITKIVEEFAKALNFKLGKNWKTNLSASIHHRNADYKAEIFEQVSKAYKMHTDELTEKKNKNKPSKSKKN